MNDLAVVVLAAGLGERMGSNIPKVLHKINEHALVDFVLETWKDFDPWKIVVVVGYKRELVEEHLRDKYPVEFAFQEEQLGTAHAAMMALPYLESFNGNIAVVCGDVPFISSDTIRKLITLHKDTSARATLLTAFFDDPSGYGRIIRGDKGEVLQIVEHKDCTGKQKLVKEINSGTYVFPSRYLRDTINKVDSNNKQGEYYLTDVIKFLQQRGERVSALCVKDNREVMGINSPSDLEAAKDYYINEYFFP